MNWKDAKTIYDFTVKDIDGNDVSLEKYRYILRVLQYMYLIYDFVSCACSTQMNRACNHDRTALDLCRRQILILGVEPAAFIAKTF